ncbi:MAG: TetR/AcrR family transcriptional regulator [Desulfomonilia bacterium]|jgi:AcrR family transcriptional regulator
MESNRIARKNIIVDAAQKVFAEKPFTKVSMRDIAKEAGISPALIYRHFPDQQHLFVEAFLRGTKRLIEQFSDLLSRDERPQVEEAADIFITYLTDHDQYFKMMTHFMLEGTIHEGLLDKLNSIERSMLDQFGLLFENTGAKHNVRMISHCFFSALNGILITFRQHPGRSAHEVREHMHHIGHIMARMFLYAARSEETDIFSKY